MSELNLPKLPSNYRWKISNAYAGHAYDSVKLSLQRTGGLAGLFGAYLTVRAETVRSQADLAWDIEGVAQRLFDQEFKESDAAKYEGIYDGND